MDDTDTGGYTEDCEVRDQANSNNDDWPPGGSGGVVVGVTALFPHVSEWPERWTFPEVRLRPV